MESLLYIFALIFWILIILAILFLPSIIAFKRRHNNFIPIFIVNIIGTFTGVGWVVAIIWSFTDNVKTD